MEHKNNKKFDVTLKNTSGDVDLTELWGLIPQNSHRSVNKILKKGTYFDLEYNINNKHMMIVENPDVVYSAIPYDFGRKYIRKAAILTLLYPKAIETYLKRHKSNLLTYIDEALTQCGKSVDLDKSYYDEIFKHKLFMIQIAGRMLQHDETGPLSASLSAKFLYDINLNTGITGYLSEFLNFVVAMTNELPLVTDGDDVLWISDLTSKKTTVLNPAKSNLFANFNSGAKLFLEHPDMRITDNIIGSNSMLPNVMIPLSKAKYGDALKQVRDNYIAHSIAPTKLEKEFENIFATDNYNLVNVVSDTHSRNGKLPFHNDNFNILAGDLSDSLAKNKDINGVMVIGNHEVFEIIGDALSKNVDFKNVQQKILVEVVNKNFKYSKSNMQQIFEKYDAEVHDVLYDSSLDEFYRFRDDFWFKAFLFLPDESWAQLPLGDSLFYEGIQKNIQKRFSKITVLNNSVVYHDGIRYVGLTIPVARIKQKSSNQRFLSKTLANLLGTDTETPTVIVSHAPIFNELSMLSPKSSAYKKNNNCSSEDLYNIFKEYNIIGAIHGHHHIPASHGIYKNTTFAGRKMFVVCSIYSKMNTGFELENLLSKYRNQKL